MFKFVFSAIILLVIFFRLFRYAKGWITYVNALSHIPGPPFLTGLSLAWELGTTNRFKRYFIVLRLIEQYGTFFKVWLGTKPVIYIAQPEEAMAILSSNKNIDKTFAYKFFYPWLGTGLLTANGNRWHQKRKILTPAFHFSILLNFFNTMVEHSKKLVETLDEELEKQQFNICPYISNCSLDIICETAMGVKLDDETNVLAYRNSIRRINQIILHRAYCPWLWLDIMYQRTGRYKEQQEHLKILHGFSLDVIQKRKNERKNKPKVTQTTNPITDDERKERPAFLDLLLDISESGEMDLSDTDIREEVDTFMFEGHDTVSAAIMWSIFWLGTHKNYQAKVYEELKSVFGNSKRDPTPSEINELTYLDMAVKETMRISPSVPIISRCLTEDAEVGDKVIPAGTTTVISLMRLHRLPSQYSFIEEFNPENFSPENVLRRHYYAYLPFSAGPRNCIGQKFGMMEVKVVLSTLFRNFEFETLCKAEEMKVASESVLYPESGVFVKIKKRDSNVTYSY